MADAFVKLQSKVEQLQAAFEAVASTGESGLARLSEMYALTKQQAPLLHRMKGLLSSAYAEDYYKNEAVRAVLDEAMQFVDGFNARMEAELVKLKGELK